MANRAFKVLVFQMKQALVSPQVLLVLLLIAVFVFSAVQPMNDFSRDVGINVTPWIFPHITNDYVCQLVIMSASILLFCNAPFKNDLQKYLLIRAGNAAWAIGICLYIILLSLIYTFIILFVTVLAVLPQLDFTLRWGKILGTLSRTAAAGKYYGLSISINNYIIGAYSPTQATLICFGLEWACCALLGLLTYNINLISQSAAGAYVSAAFVFLDITIANDMSYIFYRFSPVTMAQLSKLTGVQSMYGLTTNYAVAFFLSSILILILLCIFLHCKKLRISW